jgi:quercetin dioxygenase-like cupin family protein
MRELTRTATSTTDRTYALGDGEGRATWFAGALILHKADGSRTENRLDLLDQAMPSGYAVPRHRHEYEDEAWYVLEGDVTFACGSHVIAADRGSWVFGPRGVAHSFRVGPQGARMLTLSLPSGFAGFVDEFGESADRRTIPPAGALDTERLTRVARKYGIELTGEAPS